MTPPPSRRAFPAAVALLPDPEERFWALFEQTNDGVFLIGRNLRHLAANQRAAEITGYTVDELVGMPIRQLIHPSHRAAGLDRAREIFRGERFDPYERALRTKAGAMIPVELNVTLIRDAAGNPLFLQSIVRDISARRREQESLRLLVEGVAEATGLQLLDNMVKALAEALDVKRVLLSQTDPREPTRAIGLALWDDGIVLEPGDHDLPATSERGEPCFVPRGAREICPDDEHVARVKRAESYLRLPLVGEDGRTYGELILVDTKPMSEDLLENWLLWVFSARALGELERLHAQRALESSERRYRQLVESLPAVVFESPPELEQCDSYVGPGIERLTGFTVEEWTRPPSQRLLGVSPEHRQRLIDAVERTRLTDAPLRVEYRFRRKDGREIWVREEAKLIRHGSERPVLQGLLLDVTERRQLEEQALMARKIESLAQLAGGIAHDFNNLLMTTLGNLSLSKLDLPPDSPGFDRLVEAERAMLRAKGLTLQLQAFAKGGAPIRRPGSIRDLIRETASFTASGGAVHVALDVPQDLWQVEMDTNQIARVVENLVLNAVQAMPATGRGTVHVRARNLELTDEDLSLPVTRGRWVWCTVSDTGSGISSEDLPRIFDPYFTTKSDGVGLGLATCQTIVHRHEGHITAESQPGEGTSVTFYLPAAAEASPAAEPASEGRRTHVLVMDDDPSVRQTVTKMIERLGHRVTAASSGEEAIDLYRSRLSKGERFDLVLMDLTVTDGMGGRQATSEIKRIDPGAIVIVSSGYSENPVIADFRSHDFDGCLAKPYLLDQLRETLDETLARASANVESDEAGTDETSARGS